MDWQDCFYKSQVGTSLRFSSQRMFKAIHAIESYAQDELESKFFRDWAYKYMNNFLYNRK